MANSGLRGPTALSSGNVDMAVNKVSPGAYALGFTDQQNTFNISYVGRSDDDVAARLKQHVGNYREFKFEYYPSAKAAFDKECTLYHDFNPPDNKIHPDRPKGANWRCPGCSIFG